MSYNWVDASTKQGLERFKELGDMKLAVITRSGDGTLSECFCEPDGTIVINQVGYEDWEDAEENNAFFSLEFLDPEPQKPHPITIDEMREYCIKWCEGHEEPLDSGNWCSARPQHAERPMAWHICSTFFSANDSADNQIQLVYAIIRAIESGEISQVKEANP